MKVNKYVIGLIFNKENKTPKLILESVLSEDETQALGTVLADCKSLFAQGYSLSSWDWEKVQEEIDFGSPKSIIPETNFLEGELLQELLNTSIDHPSHELSIRLRNSLHLASIHTIRKAIAQGPEDIVKYRNFGPKCLKEFEDFMKAKRVWWNIDLKVPEE